jgi:putative ABC transport system substrate-binding protein
MAAEHRGLPLSRRHFVQGAGAAGLGLLVACGRLPGQTAPVSKAPRIAVLMTRSSYPQFLDALLQGLHELGYVEGENFTLVLRSADGDVARLPQLASELVGLQVDVIVTQGTPATQAASQATRTIPIVQPTGGDLVAAGLVASLAHPGGNVTGLDSNTPQLSRKRLQLLTEVAPGITRTAVVWNPSNPVKRREWTELQTAATLLGVQLLSHEVRDAGEADREMATIPDGQPDSLVAMGDAVIDAQAARIAAFATASRLPSVFETRRYVEPGGLMSYGPNVNTMHHRGAYYVDRILKGTKPADLPVEQPTTFEFVINLQTAQSLGITIPQHVLLQATEVIQ